MKTFSKLVLLCAGLMLAGQAAAADLQFGRDASMKDATKASMEKNRQEIAVLDFGLQDDFADAKPLSQEQLEAYKEALKDINITVKVS